MILGKLERERERKRERGGGGGRERDTGGINFDVHSFL